MLCLLYSPTTQLKYVTLQLISKLLNQLTRNVRMVKQIMETLFMPFFSTVLVHFVAESTCLKTIKYIHVSLNR